MAEEFKRINIKITKSMMNSYLEQFIDEEIMDEKTDCRKVNIVETRATHKDKLYAYFGKCLYNAFARVGSHKKTYGIVALCKRRCLLRYIRREVIYAYTVVIA